MRSTAHPPQLVQRQRVVLFPVRLGQLSEAVWRGAKGLCRQFYDSLRRKCRLDFLRLQAGVLVGGEAVNIIPPEFLRHAPVTINTIAQKIIAAFIFLRYSLHARPSFWWSSLAAMLYGLYAHETQNPSCQFAFLACAAPRMHFPLSQYFKKCCFAASQWAISSGVGAPNGTRSIFDNTVMRIPLPLRLLQLGSLSI